MSAHVLEGGFQQPAVEAAQAFRSVMDAMARPGTIKTLTGVSPPEPLSTAAGVCILTLCDHETPIYLAESHDNLQAREWIAFHTGAPISDPADCIFALGSWDCLQPLSAYPPGTAEYPDRSATLIVELDKLSDDGALLSGPGIRQAARLSLPDITVFRDNHKQYPLGLDFLFTADNRVAALPRSTEVNQTPVGD